MHIISRGYFLLRILVLVWCLKRCLKSWTRWITEIKVSLELTLAISIYLPNQKNHLQALWIILDCTLRGRKLAGNWLTLGNVRQRNSLLFGHHLVASSEYSSKVTRGKNEDQQIVNWKLINTKDSAAKQAGLGRSCMSNAKDNGFIQRMLGLLKKVVWFWVLKRDKLGKI